MQHRYPYWLYANLLSLDAPIVATVWVWIFAKTLRVMHVADSSYWMLAGTVWCIYVLDRIVDVWKRGGSQSTVVTEADGEDIEHETRHVFHWRNRNWLLMLVGIVLIVLGYSAFNVTSDALLTAGVAGGGFLLLYVLVSKIDRGPVAYLKNFVSALTFAYGVAATVSVESMELRMSVGDLCYHFSQIFEGHSNGAVGLGPAISYLIYNVVSEMIFHTWSLVLFSSWLPLLFAGLCYGNIMAIDLWEHSRRSENPEEKQRCENILSIGLVVLIAAAFVLAATTMTELERPFVYAIMISAALLQMINKKRSHFYLDALSVLVDLAMIVPFPIVYLMFYS